MSNIDVLTNCVSENTTSWYQNNCPQAFLTATEADKKRIYDLYFEQVNTQFPNAGFEYYGQNGSGSDFAQDTEEVNFQYLVTDTCGRKQDSPAIGGGLCTPGLLQVCARYTREDMENPILRNMCGCYLPDSEYNVARQCDPICSNINTIKYFPLPTDKLPPTCVQNVCIIDDITIRATQSQLGSITFDQLCKGCGGAAECRCVIADINILVNNERLTNINFRQECGNSSTCYSNEPGKAQVQIPCDQFFAQFNGGNSGGNSGGGAVIPDSTRHQYAIIAIIISIAVLLILLLVGILYYFKKK